MVGGRGGAGAHLGGRLVLAVPDAAQDEGVVGVGIRNQPQRPRRLRATAHHCRPASHWRHPHCSAPPPLVLHLSGCFEATHEGCPPPSHLGCRGRTSKVSKARDRSPTCAQAATMTFSMHVSTCAPCAPGDAGGQRPSLVVGMAPGRRGAAQPTPTGGAAGAARRRRPHVARMLWAHPDGGRVHHWSAGQRWRYPSTRR